jgi:hypothetical protein
VVFAVGHADGDLAFALRHDDDALSAGQIEATRQDGTEFLQPGFLLIRGHLEDDRGPADLVEVGPEQQVSVVVQERAPAIAKIMRTR